MIRDIGTQVKHAALWTYARTFLISVLSFIGGIILARILGPADFGVFIAATAFTTVLSVVVNFGLPQALVRQDHVNNEHYNAAFWTMSSVAVICAGILWVASSFLEKFYDDERFSVILVLMTLTYFMIPYVSVNNAVLRRAMDFRTVSLIAMKTTIFVMSISIALALYGIGAFALVAGGIVALLSASYMSWRKTHWLPGFPKFEPVFPILPYAFKANLNNIQTVFTGRVDNMLVGALLGTSQLGIYNRAFSLARMPVEQLAENLQPVLFSGLAKIKDDSARSRQIYHKSICILALAVFPLLALFWLIAADFIVVLYGQAWAAAAEPMRIMTIGAAAFLLTLSFRSISAAQNLVGKEAWVHFIGLILLIVFVLFSARWGISAVAIGVTAKELIVFAIFQTVIARSHLRYGWGALSRALTPAFIATLSSVLVVYLCFSWLPGTPWARLLIIAALYLSVYLASAVIMSRLWKAHVELASAVDFLKSLFVRSIEGLNLRKLAR